MKYGVLYNKGNSNIGDDIQAYAIARFLPTLDCFIDREHIDEFITEDKKAVAVIMNAWYMWRKWNWPPSKYIYPHFVGMHYADHQLAKQPGTIVKYEYLEGLGGEYLKAYGPIGCRDHFTRKNLEKRGIDCFYSGCITLTLPKQPETKDKGTYVCLVDLEPRVRDKLKSELEEKGIEVREFTHTRPRDPDMPWKKRLEIIKERLTIYQNAKCVVTKKLHCSLPCLAMEVPVFLIKEMEKDIRFDPYNDFLHRTTVTKFMKDDYDYDFSNPPANKPDYKKVREALIKSCEEFVERTKDLDGDPDELNKFTCSKEDLMLWRHDVMKDTMDKMFDVHKKQSDTLQIKTQEVKENVIILRSYESFKDKVLRVSKRETKKILRKILRRKN